jgi:hypothetical protein
MSGQSLMYIAPLVKPQLRFALLSSFYAGHLHVSVDLLLQAYGKTRLQGSDEIGEVLLSISSELLTFDFKETFVNAFDVS